MVSLGLNELTSDNQWLNKHSTNLIETFSGQSLKMTQYDNDVDYGSAFVHLVHMYSFTDFTVVMYSFTDFTVVQSPNSI